MFIEVVSLMLHEKVRVVVDREVMYFVPVSFAFVVLIVLRHYAILVFLAGQLDLD